MKKEKMYAKCLDNKGVPDLEMGKEYRVKGTVSFSTAGCKYFLVLENGLYYEYGHFSVTYLK
jgi:hypothetical protein